MRERALFGSEWVVLNDRPSCPHCGSRRWVDEVVGAATYRRRETGCWHHVDVWRCWCPTFDGTEAHFGVMRPEPLDDLEPLSGEGDGDVERTAR